MLEAERLHSPPRARERKEPTGRGAEADGSAVASRASGRGAAGAWRYPGADGRGRPVPCREGGGGAWSEVPPILGGVGDLRRGGRPPRPPQDLGWQCEVEKGVQSCGEGDGPPPGEAVDMPAQRLGWEAAGLLEEPGSAAQHEEGELRAEVHEDGPGIAKRATGHPEDYRPNVENEEAAR